MWLRPKRKKDPVMEGLEPPQWFIDQSDGGSAPLGLVGKFLVHEPSWRLAAWYHDYGYYLVGLQWRGPEKGKEPEPAWVGHRHEADYAFKINRKACARNRLLAPFRAMYCYRAVRAGGQFFLLKPEELVVPPTLHAVDEIQNHCRYPLTEQAATQLEEWRYQLTDRGGST